MITTLNAHAKINLNLRIHRKREDGFHELTSLMAPIALADRIEITPARDYHLTCDTVGVPTDESNLVTKAVRKLEHRLGNALNYEIKLFKNIPHGAGLGGGSSDAATVLKYLNAAEGNRLNLDELSSTAAELGSDVPFFLHGCICECSGRGEIIIPRPNLRPALNLVLLKPHFGVSTPDAYKRWQGSKNIPSIDYRLQLVEEIQLINDLERPVFEKHRFLAETKRWLLDQTETTAAMMSGSGSTMFAVIRDPNTADNLIARAREDLDPNLWSWAGKLAQLSNSNDW